MALARGVTYVSKVGLFCALSSLSLIFYVGFISLGLTNKAEANEKPTCYSIGTSHDMAASSSISRPQSQIWCYQNLQTPMGALYIFNADRERVRPELALVRDADGTITYGSLLHGKISFHKTSTLFLNPLPAPLDEPVLAPRAFDNEKDVEIGQMATSAAEVLNVLLFQPTELHEFSLEPGTFTYNVPLQHLPWRGYWWPYHGQPMSAVLSKYDRYVKSKTGVSPQAASWENTYHLFKDIAWEGHCNGWAASAILRPQPTAELRDAQSGIRFSTADQKGLLAEVDYCSVVAFYGRRYRGDGDIRDIHPDVFHKVLLHYIGALGKPIAMDYMQAVAVDNHIISGFKMDIVENGNLSFKVTAKLTIHKYDSSRALPPGVAPTYFRTYRYTLQTDLLGAITGGSWLTTNPDFLWVPLSTGACSSNNPRLNVAWAESILSLPPSDIPLPTPIPIPTPTPMPLATPILKPTPPPGPSPTP